MEINRLKIKATTKVVLNQLIRTCYNDYNDWDEVVVTIIEQSGYSLEDLWNEDGTDSELLTTTEKILIQTCADMNCYYLFN